MKMALAAFVAPFVFLLLRLIALPSKILVERKMPEGKLKRLLLHRVGDGPSAREQTDRLLRSSLIYYVCKKWGHKTRRILRRGHQSLIGL
jgi:hypothetical protein